MIESASLIVLIVLCPNGLSIVPIIFSDSSASLTICKMGTVLKSGFSFMRLMTSVVFQARFVIRPVLHGRVQV